MGFDSSRHHRPFDCAQGRRSIRLRGYDYRHAGAYFVTLVTCERECLFGDVVEGEMVLSGHGQIADQCWRNLAGDFPRIQLGEYIVMPNHIHGIIWITDQDEEPCRGVAIAAPGRDSEAGRDQGEAVANQGICRGEAFPPDIPAGEDRGRGAMPPPPRTGQGNASPSLEREPGQGEAFARPGLTNGNDWPGAAGPAAGRITANASPLQQAERPRGAPPGSLGAIVGNFKSVAGRYANRVRRKRGTIWQRGYYEHIVRNEGELGRIEEYIINNPAEWDQDPCNPQCKPQKKPRERWQV